MVDHVRAWHPGVPSLHEVYYAQFAHCYPKHTHSEWTVMLVDDGAVAYDLDHRGDFAVPNALTLLPPEVPHDGRPASEGVTYRKRVLYLAADWLPTELQRLAADRSTLADPDLIIAVERVHQALQSPGDLMAAEHWLLTVRDRLLERMGGPTESIPDVPLARRLRTLLDDRLTESFTIAEAAGHLGAHPSHLIRVFSQTYGIAPHQYQVTRRVERARRLLVDGHRPAEAAVLTGFHDQAHLTRHFRKILGITPSTLAPQTR